MSVLLVTDKVLQNQGMAARTKVTLLVKAFALERRVVYLLPADIVSRRPSCRLSDDNQPVIRIPNWFSSPRPRLLACI